MDSEYIEKIKMFHRAYEIWQRIDELEEKGANFYPKEQTATYEEFKEWNSLRNEAHEYYMRDSREWISNRKQGILTGVLLIITVESLIIAFVTLSLLL